MLTIETKQLVISDKLRKKIEMMCKFLCVKSIIINGSIKSIKETNIAYVKPHTVIINNNSYFIFEECDDLFINDFNNKIKFKDLEKYIKMN